MKRTFNLCALRRAVEHLEFWEVELDCAKMDGERTDLIQKNIDKYRADIAELKRERGIHPDVQLTA